MYTVDVQRTRRIDRGGVVVGAVAVLVSDSGEPEVVLRWSRTIPPAPGGQTPAQFRTMLLGGGSVAQPQGELGAYLAMLNAGAEELADL